VLVLAVLGAAGCADDDVCAPFAGTCLALELAAPAGDSLLVDQLALSGEEGFVVSNGNLALSPPAPRAAPVAPPIRLAVQPPSDFAGSFGLAVYGLVAGSAVGRAELRGVVARGQHLRVTGTLDRVGNAVDGGAYYDFSNLAYDFSNVVYDPSSSNDLAGPAASGPCSTVPQAVCPSGEKCTLPGGTLGDPVCRPAGALAVGAGCTPSSDQCVAGALCLGDTAANADSMCRQLCNHDNGDQDCTEPPGPGGSANYAQCVIVAVGSASISLCSHPCNPVLAAGSSGCPLEQRCDYQAFTSFERTDCRTFTGSGTDGAACQINNQCAAGYGCMQLGFSSSYVCRQFCRMHSDSDCAQTGYVCKPELIFQSNTLFGVCCPSAGC
jgi:hypothetical protein